MKNTIEHRGIKEIAKNSSTQQVTAILKFYLSALPLTEMTENNELLKSPKQTKEIFVLGLTKAKANEIH